MKKILSSVMAIMLAVGLVAGSAAALFSDTVTVSGLSIAAGNADVRIGPDGDTYYDVDWPLGLSLTGVYPGWGVTPQVYSDFYVWNASTSNISLDLAARLSTLPTNWGNELTYAVQLYVEDMTTNAGTGWMSLPRWASDVTLPGGALSYVDGSDERQYRIYVRVPYHYGDDEAAGWAHPWSGTEVGNEISLDDLTNGVMMVTGTQHP